MTYMEMKEREKERERERKHELEMVRAAAGADILRAHAKAQDEAIEIESRTKARVMKKESEEKRHLHRMDIINELAARNSGEAFSQLLAIAAHGLSSSDDDDEEDYKKIEKKTAKKYVFGFNIPTEEAKLEEFVRTLYSSFDALKELEDRQSMSSLFLGIPSAEMRKALADKTQKILKVYYPKGMETSKSLLKDFNKKIKAEKRKGCAKGCLITLAFIIICLIALVIDFVQDRIPNF